MQLCYIRFNEMWRWYLMNSILVYPPNFLAFINLSPIWTILSPWFLWQNIYFICSFLYTCLEIHLNSHSFSKNILIFKDLRPFLFLLTHSQHYCVEYNVHKILRFRLSHFQFVQYLGNPTNFLSTIQVMSNKSMK